MVDRNAPPLPPGEANRLFLTSDQAIRARQDSLPSESIDLEKSPREIAQEILQRRLGEDRALDRRAEARQGDREQALEEHYRERVY
jgi:hypothetical protein